MTVTFPVPPLLIVTLQLNVAPRCIRTSPGQLAFVTLTEEVERSCSMPCSICAASTVRLGVGWAVVPVPGLEPPPQPAAASAPAASPKAADLTRRRWPDWVGPVIGLMLAPPGSASIITMG